MNNIEKGEVIVLSRAQRQVICEGWIREMGQWHYKKMLDLILSGCSTGPAAWTDILDYAIQYCSKNFCVEHDYGGERNTVVDILKRALSRLSTQSQDKDHCPKWPRCGCPHEMECIHPEVKMDIPRIENTRILPDDQRKPAHIYLRSTWIFELDKLDTLLVLKALRGSLTDAERAAAIALGDRLTELRYKEGKSQFDAWERAEMSRRAKAANGEGSE